MTVYESSLDEPPSEGMSGRGKFVKLEYGVESGEAERIAVDGVSRGMSGDEHAGALSLFLLNDSWLIDR